MLLLTEYFTHTRRIRSHTHTHTHNYSLHVCVAIAICMYVMLNVAILRHMSVKQIWLDSTVARALLQDFVARALLQEHSRLWFQIGEHRPLLSHIYTFLHTHFFCYVVQIPTAPQIVACWFQLCYNHLLPGSGTWTVGNAKRHWRAITMVCPVWLSVVTAGRWLQGPATAPSSTYACWDSRAHVSIKGKVEGTEARLF